MSLEQQIASRIEEYLPDVHSGLVAAAEANSVADQQASEQDEQADPGGEDQ